MKPFTLIGCCCLLLGATIVQLGWRNKKALPGKGRHLEAVLPAQLGGWIGREAALGTTEAAEGEAKEILRFDDVYFRDFSSVRGTLSLYVAYWSPGKMPTQLVAAHTPDRCWTSAGWNCREIRHGVALPRLKPGEWREFAAPNGSKVNVVFWHIVGTELYDYGSRFTQVPSVWRWWRDVAKQIVSYPQEQYFVRLASDRPFTEMQNDPGYQQLVASIGKLGL